MKLQDLVSKEIFKQNGYQAPELSGAIKLDANENPFGLRKNLQKELLAEFGKISLNRYPAAGAPELRERFASYYGVHKDMIMLGNGSDELIQLLCLTFKGKIKGVMVPVPTFSMYKIISINTGNKMAEVPLNKNFDLDVAAMMDRIKSNFPAVIYLSYPNSPTGNCFSKSKIEAIIKKTPGIVVVDEAYASFSGATLLPLLKKYDNLVILKTLSKLGLAAMRLGFLIGNKELLAEIDKVRLPYNVNSLSQAAAGFFLDHQAEFSKQVAEIVERREELYRGLKDIAGVRPWPSRANFIFFSCAFDSDRIYTQLAARGIVVKNLQGHPLTGNCIRVTVGTRQENAAFLTALKDIIP
ncbi:MAG TPA: histidinol-phosphate transaminase [Smithellaceae bacterium]|nr:histidinol-phosphate transaminase [Smithellaceae bacterium]